MAPAIVGLARMATLGRRVPVEDPIVVVGVAVANAAIVLRPPDILLDPECTLARLVDEPPKAGQQAVFHRLTDGAQTLRMRMPLGPDRFHPPVPLRKCDAAGA